ncbi:hypothetical protein [Bradyrhizobium sp. HKCCYLS2033]|uniref:hypothetical protein n=1 Tax=unclassified Bradyrhizobium TaxID=2631580 RepID=UPI003EB7E538
MSAQGGLYYPYIKFRNEQWLKSTLLVFPKVFRMIPDRFHPEDSEGVRDLESKGLLDYADLSTPGVRRALGILLKKIERDVEADPRFAARFSKAASDRMKRLTGDPYGYQLHSFKAKQLLEQLKDLDLAWAPEMPDGDHYLEMHPHIGEGIMSTLAVACALDDGLDIVADEAPLHDCVVRHAEDELYSKLIKRRRRDAFHTFSVDRCKIELLVFQQFDLSKLTATNIIKLHKEGNELARFHDEMTKVAQSIRAMREEARFEHRLKEKVGTIIADWEKSKAKPRSFIKEFFGGSEKPAGDFLKKVAELAAGPTVAGAAVGGLTTGALLGAAAGLGVALVIHTSSSVRAVQRNAQDSPYRVLTLLEKSGAAFTAGS